MRRLSMKVCICNDVDEKELCKEILIAVSTSLPAPGEPTPMWVGLYITDTVMKAIKLKTKATTCCGKCTPEVEKMIKDSLGEK